MKNAYRLPTGSESSQYRERSSAVGAPGLKPEGRSLPTMKDVPDYLSVAWWRFVFLGKPAHTDGRLPILVALSEALILPAVSALPVCLLTVLTVHLEKLPEPLNRLWLILFWTPILAMLLAPAFVRASYLAIRRWDKSELNRSLSL